MKHQTAHGSTAANGVGRDHQNGVNFLNNNTQQTATANHNINNIGNKPQTATTAATHSQSNNDKSNKAQALQQSRHKSVVMNTKFRVNNDNNHNQGGSNINQKLPNYDQSEALRRDINQQMSRTTTMKRASESLSSPMSNKIVPLQVNSNGRLSRPTPAKKDKQLRKQQSSDSNSNNHASNDKKKNDIDVHQLIKQIEEKRKEINAIKGKNNNNHNHLNANNNLQKKSSIEIGGHDINSKTNFASGLKNLNSNFNTNRRNEVSSSSSGNEGTSRGLINVKSSRKHKRKTEGARTTKNIHNNAHNGDFLNGFQLLDQHKQKNANGIHNSPTKIQPGGKLMQLKAFIDEAKQENIDFEKSSSDSEAGMSQKSSSRKMISSNDHRKNGPGMGYSGQETGRQPPKINLNAVKDQNHDIIQTKRSEMNPLHGASNNASFIGPNYNPSMNHTINSDNNQDNSQINDDPNRSKVMNFSLLDDQILKKKMPKFVINPTALWKTVWNVLGLLLILFLAITVPYRIPFEDVTPDSWVYLDIVIDSIFMFDVILNFFTAYEDENGELITERNKIAKNYMKTWFVIDMVSSVPITLIQKYSQQGGVDNIKLLKLSRLPRLYRLLRLIKLMRLYKSNKFVEKLFAAVNISVTANRMITSLIMMIFLLHLIGCLWATVASLTQGAYPSIWMNPVNLVDSENIDQYVASVYWAAVTIYTVGYGDITPQNEMEMMSCVLILFTGVSLYAYMFSKLSTLFSSVNANDNNQKTRDEIIQELSLKHRFTNDLMNKIQYFFQQNSNLISLSKEYAIDELLEILPAHLKSEISYFLYRDAIETIKILQDKDQRFYGDYLSKFEPMRIKNGTVFAKEGTSPQEVFFLLKGCVQCERQEKYYLEGTIFGETDIILKRNRSESYVAKSDCYILKLEASIFEQILDEFEDIREEIQQIVVEREKKRIEDMQQQKLKKEDPKIELKRLMSKINLEEMQVQRKQSYKKLGTFKSEGEKSAPHQQEQPQQTVQSSQNQAKSSGRPSFRNVNLHVDTGKNYVIKSKDPHISSIQAQHDSSNKVFGTFGNQESLESGVDVQKSAPGNNHHLHSSPKSKFDQSKKTNQMIKPSTKISPMIDRYTSNYMQSPEFSYNKLMFGRPPMNNAGANPKMSMHMKNIENIKNNIRESLFHEDIDKNIIEERIQETKQQIRLENQMKELEKIDNMEEFGYDSNRQSQGADDFNHQLRQSLMKLQKSTEYQKVQRKATQKDKPVNAGNNNENNRRRDYDQLPEEYVESQVHQEELMQPAAPSADIAAITTNHNNNMQTTNTTQQQQHIVNLNDSLMQNSIEQININHMATNFNQTQIDSQRNVQTAMDVINNNTMTLMTMINMHTHENINGMNGGNIINNNGGSLEDTQHENYHESNKTLNSYLFKNLEQMEPYNPNTDPLLENDVQKLSQHIMSCLSSISNTRLLIVEYCQLFRTSIDQMGEDANEIIRQHYVQGVKCLESYLSIMNLIEKLIQSIDLQAISSKISNIQIKTNESEKRFYFLENRVKMLQEVLSRKIKMLEKQRARMLSKKPLVIVKRNPLLDPRDDRHLKFNEKLFMGNEPSNM